MTMEIEVQTTPVKEKSEGRLHKDRSNKDHIDPKILSACLERTCRIYHRVARWWVQMRLPL